MRLDVYLSENGVARSRSRASELIKKGLVTVNGKTQTKPSFDVPEGALVESRPDTGFVGRGGEKLEGAVRAFSLDFTGKTCVDLGASTGGFTDCMLRRGAVKVWAVDVGTGQLDPGLAADPRVVNMENTNIRYMDPSLIGETDFAAADVSFISLKYIFPVMRRLLSPEGCAVCLVKPQFEAGREHIGKNGVVKDKKIHRAVLLSVMQCAKQNGLYPVSAVPSPIRGGDGNAEFLLYLSVKPEEERNIDPEVVVQ